MKRRGFLGFLGGAAVAGPGMVKQAAAQGLADLRLPSGLSSVGGMYAEKQWSEATGYGSSDGGLLPWYVRKWNAFQDLVNSADRMARKRREMHVNDLDPDLVNCRSFSLSAKIRIQRERNFQKWLERERSWFAANPDGPKEDDDWY